MKRALLGLGLAACGGSKPHQPQVQHALLSVAADERMIAVPAGNYIAGSTPEERAASYDDYQQTAGQDSARENKWFDTEEDRRITELPAFRIDLMPVTQAQYAEMVTAGKAKPPAIDEAAWKTQGFNQDFATEVARFVWKDGRPPTGREDHPVVLVTHEEAVGYCVWRGAQRGEKRRLPTAAEYEKAARGEGGLSYPWGNAYEADKLNSAVKGPKDTTPAGQFNDGASPFGVLELAGNVFQWTATPEKADRMVVKGSAWEDFAGVGRGASFHGRAKTARHVIVGFRCAADP
ncbi:MAG: formylglycine-generating enzyme family protein [Myxococcota bacterium]|nr:formylglycine-generating enzyme family protein [Myxococcota bacterium]